MSYTIVFIVRFIFIVYVVVTVKIIIKLIQ